jgi:hypothetical protein
MADCFTLGSKKPSEVKLPYSPLDYIEQLPGSLNPYPQGRETHGILL